MKRITNACRLWRVLLAVGLPQAMNPGAAHADTTLFFDSAQTTNVVNSGTTSDTIGSEGYLFTLTRDKLLTVQLSAIGSQRFYRLRK